MSLLCWKQLARNASRRGLVVAPTSAASRQPSGHFMAWRAFSSSDSGGSITYSGGQATQGQGGFYGSGGARVIDPDKAGNESDEARMQVLALAADVQLLVHTMEEYNKFDTLLSDQTDDLANTTIELKAAIKKLWTQKDVNDAMNRLLVNGEPVWGLSSEERELVMDAREIIKDC